jgi:hypothetical protein
MNEQDKKIKELLKGNFDEPIPSADFTKNVMENIALQAVLKEQNQFEYVPVISKIGWFIIGVLFFAISGLGLTSAEGEKFSVLNYVPDLQFDLSIIHSQLWLFAVMSIFTLLIIDRLIIRFRLNIV